MEMCRNQSFVMLQPALRRLSSITKSNWVKLIQRQIIFVACCKQRVKYVFFSGRFEIGYNMQSIICCGYSLIRI